MTTYVFGQKKQRVSVVLYEEFTGDGSDVTFQLTSSPANATWLATHGAWAAGNIHTTYPAHITKTNKKPIYDSVIPLTRNRITVSSISAGGLVTLDYAPRNNVDFYVWYWYQLSTDDILSAYYRADFIASMEGEASSAGTVNLYDTDSSNVLTLAWAEDSSNDRILNLAGLVGGDRTLTLNENLTVVDGQNIDLHAPGGEKAQLAIDTQNAERTLDMAGNLTVESNSLINQDLTTDASVNFGAVTIADGGSLSLQEDITFTGATTENQIKIPDNLLDALSIQEGSNKYVTFDTINDEEDIFFYKSVDILHTAMHADDHTLEIDTDTAAYGDVKAIDLDYITGNIIAGKDEGIILINIDETLATGGEVFGLEVLTTDQVTGSTSIHGMKVGPLIAPIHQDSGTFIDPITSTDNAVDAPNMRDHTIGNTTTIFEDENEYIVIGATTAFQDLELIFSTAATKSIKPTFWYSTGGTGFTQFTPVDGTDGCRHTGVISWDASDLTSHAANATGTFDIKIIRTRNTMTAPVLGYAKTAATTEYVWDKDGNLSINGLALATCAAAGSDTDKFLVLDGSGNVDYRTGANVLSDIGAQASDATLTAFASLLTAANKIPYATGTDTGSELDLATTVGNPGSDTTLVSEQGIREAIAAFSTTLAGLTDTTITGPADLDLLQYDNNSSKWVDRTFAEAGVAANTFTAINALIGAANAAVDLNDQALTSVGAIGCDTITVVANNDVLLSGTGYVQSGSEGFIVGTLTITDGSIDDTDGAIAFGATNFTGVGTIGCGDITTTGDYLIANGNYIGISAAERLEFYSAGYAAFMGCKVGIGTASPQKILHVQDGGAGADPNWSASDSVIFESSGNNYVTTFQPTANWGAYYFSEPGTRARGGMAYAGSTYSGAIAADTLILSSAGTEHVFINSAGSVDIAAHDAATVGLTLGGTLVTVSAALLNEAGTFFASTDISAAEAETLTDTSDADSLHTHNLKAPLASPTFTTAITIPETAGVADYDKFLVTDTGVIKYRTGAEVLSDIDGAPLASPNFTGTPLAPDHGAAATDMLVNVCYGTGNPPADPSTTTIGSLYIKYVA